MHIKLAIASFRPICCHGNSRLIFLSLNRRLASGLENRQANPQEAALQQRQQQRPLAPPPPRPKLRYQDFYDFDRHSMDRISKLTYFTLALLLILGFTGIPDTLVTTLDRYVQGDKGQTGLINSRRPEA
ncbi:hypothetical protein BOX15_Mlig020161g5 [Macrostomum lignano]|uniref:Uncharacterized protein n=1 Tax=Macrostomum lignano TaxID=282301 RepID=A0A267DHA3_9PLAT|nr:hypothetical protein BOX15_Mlig020161g5 [Macrostomum lignano]